FHYDQNNNVAYETDQSGAVVASYTYGSENEPVSMFRGGKTYFYQLNGHGDVVALTDQTGAVVNTYTYDAFGTLVNQTGMVENPYTYAGYRYDKETGLYYLQSRYYNPETGRFLTRDTFEGTENDPFSLNKYTYAYNNPINLVDSNGKNPLIPWIIRAATQILRWLGVSLRVSKHLGQRAYQRKIGPREIANTVKYGKKYYDPKEKSIVYWRKGIAVCRKGSTLTTCYRQPKPKSRWK
ncbi:MAG TPA: RHS repeat-associated core domain-containing protein, partial [Bacillus sp. (in: firmicutes)]|nr:RHS repeat-associated core domain-containing protein [Bacillus sp. (in: firmicutes)]